MPNQHVLSTPIADAERGVAPSPAVRTVAILFFDEMEELDAVGPWEVLALWAQHLATRPTRILAVSLDGGPVRCANGLRLLADAPVDEAGPIDVFVHPGGHGTRALQADPGHLDRIRALHAAGALVSSVCTGSHVLAAAGLLRDRPATSHHRTLDTLAELDASIEVRPADRFVDAGDVVTSAGVSAGIDMALHLVERLEGRRDAADRIRSVMQYEAPASR